MTSNPLFGQLMLPGLCLLLFCFNLNSASPLERPGWVLDDDGNDLETATFPASNPKIIKQEIAELIQAEKDLEFAWQNLLRATQNMVLSSALVSELQAEGYRQPLRKRGLDFGMNRGYAGSVAAKYLTGLAMANSPSGPGKK